MHIQLAEKSGFCFGVRKALQIAHDSAKQHKILSLGELIHNKHAVAGLKKTGITVIDSPEQAGTGDRVIIRSHGETPSVIRQLEEKGASIIDATCPYVKAAQQQGRRLLEEGYTVVIAGTPGHPEVIGLAGHSETDMIVQDVPSARAIRVKGKIAVISQTTLPKERYQEIVSAIRESHPDASVIDTICTATKERQESATELAKNSDVMIVVGGRHSSNTKKLATLCAEITVTYHVEDASEIQKEWFSPSFSVGVTAGASTPPEVIEDVITAIKAIDKDQ